MSNVQKTNVENSQIIEGEILEIPNDKIDFSNEEPAEISPRVERQISFPKTKNQKPKTKNQKFHLQYIFLPLIFLTVALLGGFRLDAMDDELIFLKPPLVCLIFAVILLVLFFRSGLLKLEGWFSES
ncbi:MAG: hypothetical protein ABI891_10285, partial [Acidobacteriota bacterium]